MNKKYITALILMLLINSIRAGEAKPEMAKAIEFSDFPTIKTLIEKTPDSVHDTIVLNPLPIAAVKQYARIKNRYSNWLKDVPLHSQKFHRARSKENILEDTKQILILLLENGAPINAQDKGPYSENETAFHVAVMENLPEIVELLLDYKADPLIENYYHMTPYAIAVEQGNQKMKELLSQRKIARGLAKVKGDTTIRHIKK